MWAARRARRARASHGVAGRERLISAVLWARQESRAAADVALQAELAKVRNEYRSQIQALTKVRMRPVQPPHLPPLSLGG